MNPVNNVLKTNLKKKFPFFFFCQLGLMAHPRLTNSLSSSSLRNLNPKPKLIPLCTCSCRPFSSQSLILHSHPLFLARPKPLLRFARRTGPPLVLAAVGQAEPELPQTSAPTVIPEDEVFNSITKTEFFCQILFLSFD